jgi:hypothetical protein
MIKTILPQHHNVKISVMKAQELTVESKRSYNKKNGLVFVNQIVIFTTQPLALKYLLDIKDASPLLFA